MMVELKNVAIVITFGSVEKKWTLNDVTKYQEISTLSTQPPGAH